MIGKVQDITERVRTEAVRQRAEEAIRAFVYTREARLECLNIL
jgi:hypothetical protein